ncbi:hypothetical protein CVT24_009901 [Panaeolus cyanescens]|uniref:Uncharacterized protein n=1 Tax=Panaeolus cyanescens TaxID=181874 RepID=A0A409WS58_9AGAR|nr:hypothetical protein CVT24_009901 [Panaeolus cyanescens]
MQRELDQMTHQLCLNLQISVLRPCLPSMYGFADEYAVEDDLRAAVVHSRDWFDVWIGLFCHLIAEMEEEQTRLRGFPEIAIQHWVEALVQGGHDRAVVQEMKSELVCAFDKGVKRVGTFVDLEHSNIRHRAEFVKRLEAHTVPVWYRWLPEYAHDSFLSGLGPTIPQMQENLSRTVPRTVPPPIPSNPRQHKLPPVKKGMAHPVLEFLRKRDEDNLRWEKMEHPKDKQIRLQRLQQTPEVSARVWLWMEDETGVWRRETVSLLERQDTLMDMKPYQKRYDSFHNEWHCCYELTRPADYEGEISDEEDDYGYANYDMGHDANNGGKRERQAEGDLEVGEEYMNDTQREPGVSEQGRFELAIEDMDDLAAIHNGSSSALTTDADAAEDYILQAMQIYYGYTIPLPLPVHKGKTIEVRLQNRFLKFVGIPLMRVDRALFDKPTIQCAVDFMERLGSGGSIVAEEHDAQPGHRHSLVGTRRLASLRIIRDKVQGQVYYAFDTGEGAERSWMLAVRTAAHALLVCRLPEEMNIGEVALYLVNHGIPMQTFQRSSTMPRISSLPRSNRLVPYRTKDHVFGSDDYMAYMMAVENALADRRQARAALMAGGFTWRVAKNIVSSELVLEGPTGIRNNPEDMLVVKDDKTGEEFVDDAISTLEEELICGLVECFTGKAQIYFISWPNGRKGKGEQTSRRSYYPLRKTYSGSGLDYGRWNVVLEEVFKMVKEASMLGERKPKSMSEWRDATRGAGDFRRAQIRLEQMSKAFIEGQIKGHR